MIEWEVTDDGLRVFDSDHAELTVTGRSLDFYRAAAGVPRPVDVAVDCESQELTFPAAVVYAISLETGASRELAHTDEPVTLPAGEYLVDVDAAIKTYLRVEGPLALRRSPEFDRVSVTFPERTRVTMGFRSRHRKPAHTLTVPPTPEGFATALSHLHAAHKTAGSDRSYPTLRGHPPLVETGDAVAIPDAVRAGAADTGIELVAPPSFPELFVAAPLAYYLGATVTVEPDATPLVRAPSVGLSRALPAGEEFETATTRLLRTTFFLDCLVRNAGPYGTTLAEGSLLSALELDADALYEATPAERLATYCSVPFRAIEHRLPDWHLATYVPPTDESIPLVPHLLHDMSLLYPPETSELGGSELVKRSLDDFYRGTADADGATRSDRTDRTSGSDPEPSSGARGAGEVATVDIVKPELRNARIHGWLGEGTPIDVFRSVPEAFEHRLAALDREADGIDIHVVLNDDGMAAEHEDVARIYRQRGEELPISVTVDERLTTAALARTFEADSSFLHFIGHCETDGLRCPDGNLAVESLSACNAQTFFLNACGSYYEGVELVRKGAVAGAITFSQVLNDHAVKVGSTFARLLVHGFGIERALQLARRRIMMGKDYAVVGDGTFTLAQSPNRLPASATLERVDGRYLLSYDQFSTRHTGSFYRPFLEDTEYAYLCGTESEFLLEEDDTLEFLARADMPVVYDGDVYWSDELAARLGGSEGTSGG